MSTSNLSKDNCIQIIQSDTEICPDCKNDCKIKNNDYNTTSICESGYQSNYTPYEFEQIQTQFKNLKIIPCNTCINSFYEDKFFYCLICKNNLCEYCKNHHYHDDREFINDYHIIEYGQKKYYCQQHMKQFIYYCFDCEKNLCSQCEQFHKSHNMESNGLNIAKREKELKISDELFKNFKQIFDDLINRMFSIKYKIENTYKEYHENASNYGERRTFQNLLNENAFDINYFIKDFKNIINIANNEKDDFKIFLSIIKLHNKISYANSFSFRHKEDKNLNTKSKITKEIELNIYLF